MNPDKEAITEILPAIAQAQLALSEAERAFQDMVKSMPTCREQVEQVKRERDAAVDGLRVCSIENNMECQYCLYRTARSFCWNCTDGSNWKFHGQKEE